MMPDFAVYLAPFAILGALLFIAMNETAQHMIYMFGLLALYIVAVLAAVIVGGVAVIWFVKTVWFLV